MEKTVAHKDKFMTNKLFENLVKNSQEKFIGYGNPNAAVLIIGKECAYDQTLTAFYDLTFRQNREQWLEMFDHPEKWDVEQIPSWFSPFPDAEKFSPLFPFKGEKFTINRKSSKCVQGTSTTWYNYQKLIDRIYPHLRTSERSSKDEINFLQHCFITEFSDICSRYSSKNPQVELAIKRRTAKFFNHPFFTSFPIIIVACGHYIREYGHIIDLQKLFDVQYRGLQGDWYNLHQGNGKIVIHTKQLSINISNDLLDAVAKECRALLSELNLPTGLSREAHVTY